MARAAGSAIMAIYQRDFEVFTKEDGSPLTEADLAAHHIIHEALAQRGGGIPILSEESSDDFSGADAQGQYWIVDPLDGTREFIKQNGEFTVNIALIRYGIPVIGVVYAPALDLLYRTGDEREGAAGQAIKVGAGGERTLIQVATHAQGSPWRVVCSRSQGLDALQIYLDQLGSYTRLAVGSSLKFCMVAEGSADIYPRFGPTCAWDTAAAHAVVSAAGGSVSTLDGQLLRYGPGARYLNPHFIVAGQNYMDSG